LEYSATFGHSTQIWTQNANFDAERKFRQKMGYRQTNHFKNLFKAADADGNGLLESHELKDHLELEATIHESIESFMKADGKEDANEVFFEKYYLKALENINSDAENVRHFKAVVDADNNKLVRELFKSIDFNGDGVVDLGEMKVAEEERSTQHKLFLSLMQEAEKNHPDGLTLDQFCELAGKKLTDRLVMERQRKNKSL